MKTDDLIRAIAADTGRSSMPLERAWLIAGAVAVVIAAAMFMVMLGPRSDAVESLNSVRFILKFVVTFALMISAFIVVRRMARPAEGSRSLLLLLLTAPLLLAVSVAFELAVVPSSDWAARLIGVNSTVCLTFIPLIGAGPLVVFLLALRHGAPTHPALAGAVAGLLAGGLAAAFYAAHCPDDSPLFVATWYSIAIAGLAAIGALVLPRISHW
ncbi:hypothetical protein FHS85_002535 [Rhodoligotrophos appendicifer]|uniref:NrsF family protein n=1 Tax=Rhodoligotrophos appendicifer TaxID=987056 RepID=UPI0011870BBF|nr:NrsF family protein [Rhodoligotrophos appendicifer]